MAAQNDAALPPLAFIGFGEAAKAFLDGWRSETAVTPFVYDIKTGNAPTAPQKRAEYEAYAVNGCLSAGEAAGQAGAIVSLVTASSAHDAARAAAPFITPGTLFFDGNSCAPQTKVKSAEIIEAAGGRYVDLAIMAPVHPRRHKTPMLIAGPHAQAAKALTDRLGMAAQIQDGPVGAASAIKMTRSIMIKGLEALVCECVLAARKQGIDHLIIPSLEDTFPGFGWEKRAAYMLERVMTHGRRRADEMREVTLTVDLLGEGLQGDMARSTVHWQQVIGDLQLKAADAANPNDYRDLADMILARLATTPSGDAS